MDTIPHTALVIFSLSATEELRRKKFMATADLGLSLIHDIELKAIASGLTYFLHDESLQIGNSFGERITAAIGTYFAMGYDNVIIIGNDTPQLTTNMIISTAARVSQHRAVVGQSKDNGIYLLGINRSDFNQQSFEGLPWQTSGLFTSMQLLLEGAQVDCHLLAALPDIDSLIDVRHLVASGFHNIHQAIIKCLLVLFSYVSIGFHYYYNHVIITLLLILTVRGSPAKV